MDKALVALLIIAWASCYFFWGRGLIKGTKSDAVAGVAIALALVVVLLLTNRSSGVFSLLSLPVAGFGLTTIAAAKASKTVSNDGRKSLMAIGAMSILAGIALSLVL